MPRQLTATKMSHEKWGGRGQGAGRVRETGEERAGSGREIQKGKLSLFVTAYIQSKKRTQQRFLTRINVLRGLKQNFIREKSQKTKIRTRDKKQHYFRWNWKPFQVAYIIGHEWDGMTHIHVCRLCQSCQCLVRLACCRNSPQERQSESGQMSSKTIMIGLSIFRSGGEKSLHWRHSWEHAP